MFDMPTDVNFVDDLDVALNPNEYADPAPPTPAAGRFGFLIKKMKLRTKKDSTELVLRNGKPILVIEEVEIVDPTENKRLVFLYQDFGLATFPRKDFQTGVEVPANNLSDLLRSNSADHSYSGIKEGLELLKSVIAQGGRFHAKFNWTATDLDWVTEQRKGIELAAAAEGLTADAPQVKEAVNKLYKQARKRGMNNFKNADGIVVPFFIGPSGDMVDARTEIPMDGFIPASQVVAGAVKLGPMKAR